MTNMYLENKLLLESGEEVDLDCPIELEYYLVESEISALEELAGKRIYGIGIIKKTVKECCEGELVPDFSCCITRTKEVLKKLASNSVTPIALHSVLEDIIDVY
ncbi:MAG: hypothetical protein FIA99_17115 [Ruminiclostridium sp.]|nr:hypothetical protein [Ruminiclostridium sp.]